MNTNNGDLDAYCLMADIAATNNDSSGRAILKRAMWHIWGGPVAHWATPIILDCGSNAGHSNPEPLFPPVETREIMIGGDRWGVAISANKGWAVYRATAVGLLFVQWVKQLGPETVGPIIDAEPKPAMPDREKYRECAWCAQERGDQPSSMGTYGVGGICPRHAAQVKADAEEVNRRG